MWFARTVYEMLQNRGARSGRGVHVRGTFGALSHCRRGPLCDTWRLARAFLVKFCMVVFGVEWEADTKFQTKWRLFGGWTCVSKKLRRFRGYRQNFILEWPSMWCFDWVEIFCGNFSWLEEHPLKISRDLYPRFGRCFRTAGASWALRACFVGIWHSRSGPLWDTGRLAREFLAKFCMVVAGLEWGAHTKFHPIGGRLAGEPAFRKTVKV